MPATLLTGLLALLLATGCSKQGEGERCDQDNGDLDCDTGLICVGEAQISITGTRFALCCPVTNPSVDACRARSGLEPEPDAGLSLPPPAMSTLDAGNTPAVITPDASLGATSDGGT